MRFVHVADVHLDTPFANRSDGLRRRLREATREAFRRSVALALSERVDAFLVAGDLFDGSRLSFGSERFLLDQAAVLQRAGIPLIYATGNHDCAESGGRRASLPWPGNVTVVDGPEPVRIEVPGRDGAPSGYVVACGHRSPRETRDLSQRFPRPSSHLPEVALLHTQVRQAPSAEEHGPYAPSHLGHLRTTGYAYWALGHVHLRQCLSEDPGIWYPGNPQGHDPSEIGAKGCLLVELPRGTGPRVTFHELAPIRWETLEVRDPGGAPHLSALVRSVEESWEDLRNREGGGAADWIVRVEFRGATPLWEELPREESREELRAGLTGALGALDVDVRVGPVYPNAPTDAHRGRSDVLAEALRLLERVQQGDLDALGLTPRDLAGFRSPQHASLQDYVREVLVDGGGELLSYLLAHEGAGPSP